MQRLYRRKTPPSEIISRELTRQIASLSREINRQIGLLIDRRGEVTYVMVGDHGHIWIPDLSDFRGGIGRLKGLRCVHTHLSGEPLTREDLTDLVLLALDLMVSVEVDEAGLPGSIHYAHILPEGADKEGWVAQRVPDLGQLDVDFPQLIASLEDELARLRPSRPSGEKGAGAPGGGDDGAPVAGRGIARRTGGALPSRTMWKWWAGSSSRSGGPIPVS